jgi:aminoglycoside phosphotransferase (APT) family kinase protein
MSRRRSRNFSPRPNWGDAKEIVCELFGRDAVGRITLLGEGLSNVVYGAWIERVGGQKETVVVKLPSRDAEPDRDERMRAEAVVLHHLSSQSLPFSVPRPLGEVRTRTGLAVVQEWMDGLEVDLGAPRFPGGKPWELVARVAAAVHTVDPEPLRALIRGHTTRRDHALEFALVMQELDEPEAKDSEAWVREHLPPAAPTRLLHGDLLGQNLRRSWDDGRIAVIDWAESLLGDPAYDLAIVTRGARKPFACTDGLARFLDAYNRLAETPLTTQEVHLHEVILGAHMYRAVNREYGAGSPHAENQRRAWRSVLERASSSKHGAPLGLDGRRRTAPTDLSPRGDAR